MVRSDRSRQPLLMKPSKPATETSKTQNAPWDDLFSHSGCTKLLDFLRNISNNGFGFSRKNSLLNRVSIKSRGTNTTKVCTFRDFCRYQIRTTIQNESLLKAFLEDVCSVLYFYKIFNAVVLYNDEQLKVQKLNAKDLNLIRKCYSSYYDKEVRGTISLPKIDSSNLFPSVGNMNKYCEQQMKLRKNGNKGREAAEIFRGTLDSFVDEHSSLNRYLDLFFHEALLDPLCDETSLLITKVEGNIRWGISFIYGDAKEAIRIHPNISRYIYNNVTAFYDGVLTSKQPFYHLNEEYETAYETFLTGLMPPAKTGKDSVFSTVLLPAETTVKTFRPTDNSCINPIIVCRKKNGDTTEAEDDDDDEEASTEESYSLPAVDEIEIDLDKTINLFNVNSQTSKKKQKIIDNEINDDEPPSKKQKIDNEIINDDQPPSKKKKNIIDNNNNDLFSENSSSPKGLPPSTPEHNYLNDETFRQNEYALSPFLHEELEYHNDNIELQLYSTFYECVEKYITVGNKCYSIVRVAINQAFLSGGEKDIGYLKEFVIALLLQVYLDLCNNHLQRREEECAKLEQSTKPRRKDDDEFFVDDDKTLSTSGSSITSTVEDYEISTEKKRGRPRKWLHTTRLQQDCIRKKYKRIVCLLGTEAVLAFQKSTLDSIDRQILKEIADGKYDNQMVKIKLSEANYKAFHSLQQSIDSWKYLSQNTLSTAQMKREAKDEQRLVQNLLLVSTTKNAEVNGKVTAATVDAIQSYVNHGQLPPKPKRNKSEVGDQIKKGKNKRKKGNEEHNKENSSSSAVIANEISGSSSADVNTTTTTTTTTTEEEEAEFDDDQRCTVPALGNSKITDGALPIIRNQQNNDAPPRRKWITSMFLQQGEDQYLSLDIVLSKLTTLFGVESGKTKLITVLKPDWKFTLRSLKEVFELRKDFASTDRYEDRFLTLVKSLYSFEVVLFNRCNLRSSTDYPNKLSFFSCMYSLIKHFAAEKTNDNDDKSFPYPQIEGPQLQCVDDYTILNNMLERSINYFKDLLEKNEDGDKDMVQAKLCLNNLESIQRKALEKDTNFEIEELDAQCLVMHLQSLEIPVAVFNQFEECSSESKLICYHQQSATVSSKFDWNCLLNIFSQADNSLGLCYAKSNNSFFCLALDGRKEKEYLYNALFELCGNLETILHQNIDFCEKPPSLCPKQVMEENDRAEKRELKRKAKKEKDEMLTTLKNHLLTISSSSNLTQLSSKLSSSLEEKTNNTTSAAMNIIDNLIEMNNTDD